MTQEHGTKRHFTQEAVANRIQAVKKATKERWQRYRAEKEAGQFSPEMQQLHDKLEASGRRSGHIGGSLGGRTAGRGRPKQA